MTEEPQRDADGVDDATSEADSPAEPETPLDVDAEFARIVSSYGDRPPLESPTPPGTLADRFRAHGWSPQAERTPETEESPAGVPWDDEGHYIPPEPPPIVLPEPRRLAAWGGVLGIPVLTVILALVGLPPSGLLLFLFAVGFVGGFGYLVATMKRDDDRWGDDGAVV